MILIKTIDFMKKSCDIMSWMKYLKFQEREIKQSKLSRKSLRDGTYTVLYLQSKKIIVAFLKPLLYYYLYVTIVYKGFHK